jgi:hypothetical protein
LANENERKAGDTAPETLPNAAQMKEERGSDAGHYLMLLMRASGGSELTGLGSSTGCNLQRESFSLQQLDVWRTMDIARAILGEDLAEEDAGTAAIVLRVGGADCGRLELGVLERDGELRCSLRSLSLNCALERSHHQQLRGDLATAAATGQGLFELVALAQERMAAALDEPRKGSGCLRAADSAAPRVDERHTHVLLHIDHMRAKGSYVELIAGWATSLGLCGRLIFVGRLILLYLRGRDSAVREYLRLHRTTPVDVDSDGRRCKEKCVETPRQPPHQCDCRSPGVAMGRPSPVHT